MTPDNKLSLEMHLESSSMVFRWEIRGASLGVVDEKGSFRVPAAATIFSLISNQEAIDDKIGRLTDPRKQIKELRFSKIGGRIGLILRYSDNSGLSIVPFVRRRQIVHELKVGRNQLADHVIIDGTWVYLSENYEMVIKALNDNAIDSFNNITLAQYLHLSRQKENGTNIEMIDEAKEYIDNHPMINRPQSTSLMVEPYPYQKVGISWLRFMTEFKSGCILGDEMGLGKTLQIIALIAERKDVTEKPSLIIAPASLLENWKREFNKFTDGIRICVHHGQKRTGFYATLLEYDAIITSYGTASSDLSLLKMIEWDLVILDEAQNIKSPEAIRTRSVKSLKCNSAIAVTGTPFENHMMDVWSILDFIMPGLLGTKEEFRKSVSDDVVGAEDVEPVVTPLMLRRTVSEVSLDLPEKVIVPVTITMSEEEANKYEEIRRKLEDEYSDTSASLVTLTKLRMYCTHPSIVGEERDKSDPASGSAKYLYLCNILEEIISYDEKALIFTSYNMMFDILKNDIKRRYNVPVFHINGSVPVIERQETIDDFSNVDGAAVMILNPKAAGTGLNITAASRVIHYTPEWNPSLEDQASARAYRKGQKRTVFIYRPYYKDTVEEVIQDRIERKREMFSAVVKGNDGLTENKEDIMRALRITPGGKR